MSLSNQQRRKNFLQPPRQTFGRPPPGPGGIPHYIWITVGTTVAGITYMYFAYLDQVPLTNRRRWIATSPEFERELGDQEYRQLLQKFQAKILPPSHPATRTVTRVGERIAAASAAFCRSESVKNYQPIPFTYTVVRDDMANAFVLPGNHVFVMTGLFQFVRDEDELAGVIGHEVAHTVARHAGEKISGNAVVNLLARLSLLFDPSGVMAMIFLPAATVFRELPHSRIQETEADRIGSFLSARACYDPRASKRVFASMQKQAGGDKEPPEFLSTHPSHSTRLAAFDQWMPDALAVYRGNEECWQIRQDMQAARAAAARGARANGTSYGGQDW